MTKLKYFFLLKRTFETKIDEKGKNIQEDICFLNLQTDA